MNNNPNEGFNFTGDREQPGILLPRRDHVWHLIESGSLVYTYLDKEATDKEWNMAEMTVVSLTTTDIGFNLISDDLYEVCVPDRVGLSLEAMLITRYMASKLRDTDRLSPQIAVAKIFEDVQDAPKRLWDSLEKWKEKLGRDIWEKYVDEKEILVPTKSGGKRGVMVRHYPMLDKNNNIIKHVRVHEPRDDIEFMDMSFLVQGKEAYDYEDEIGRWKIKELDKYNLGFRNTFFDNRLHAAALYRANFPHKLIYALNKKALGNHAADVFTMAICSHFFGQSGETKMKLGRRVDAETTRTKVSAKLDLLLEANRRQADPDIDLAEGVRIADGTLHNLKRGHNAPDYDNAKSIGGHSYMRQHDTAVVTQIEKCGQIDYFRRFMTHDIEDGIPTTHPLRYAVVSANDDEIYRAVPLIVLGSDDEHGKFNKIWTIRADVDFETETYNGKNILDQSTEELAEMIRVQKGQPDAVFHEVHLKRHKGVFDLETGLRAGHAPGMSKDMFRYRRDMVVDHLDDKDQLFLDKALDAFSMQYAFKQPADDIPQPYIEEEIWTAMGDIKYAYVIDRNGKMIKLPNLIREMAQDEFNRLNDRIGDTIRELLRPHRLEWAPSEKNALAYARHRAKQEKKLEDYQFKQTAGDYISLPLPDYPFSNSEVLSKKSPPVLSVQDAYSTLIQHRLYLMDKIKETTRSYEVQQKIYSTALNKDFWQTIPFAILAKMPETQIINLRDEGRLRIKFEKNPNHPSYRFAIRHFVENKMEDLLTQAQRDFYIGETSFYTHGEIYKPDPEKHRVMSVKKIMLAIERSRQNIKPGKDFLSATREGEVGAYTQYANDNFAEAIRDNTERDTKRRTKEYPLTPKIKYMFGIDPKNNEPLLNVKYEIPEDHLKIIVPDAQTSITVSHPQFGHTCIVVPDSPGIGKARHIVIEEEKSKKQFYAAGAILHILPSRKEGAYDNFFLGIDKAYRASGHAPPQTGYVLSCHELAPITRPRDRDFPSVRIPTDRLLATRDPRSGNLQRDNVLTGFLLRKYDLKFKKDQKIVLRGVDNKGEETGWEAFAEISGKTEEFSLKELLSLVDDPVRRSEASALAEKCGYSTSDDMKAAMLAEYTKFDEDILNDQNILIFFKIKPVKAIHYWTPHQPRAAFENNLVRPDNREPKPKKAKFAAKHPILDIA